MPRFIYTVQEQTIEKKAGTLLDAANRAHKRGVVKSADEVREIKDLRNQIVHEYIKEDLNNVFQDILECTPRLIEICNNIFNYCKKY